MKCCLCLQEKKLVDAHIIPKWAFMYLYPESKVQPLILIGTEGNKKSRVGVYDPNILCKECDGFIGIFNNYGKKVFLEKQLEDSQFQGLAYVIKDIKPEELKIFLLSVIWRASISKREEVKAISLGPYEDKIHNLLFKKKENKDITPDLKEFSILISRFGEGGYPDLTNKNIQLPLFTRVDGVNFNIVYFPRGFKIYIKTDKRLISEPFNKLELKDGDLIVLKLKNFQESKEFYQMRKFLKDK